MGTPPLPGQPFPMPNHFFHEEFLPDIQSKPLLDDVSSHPTCPTSLLSSAGRKPHSRHLHSKSQATEPSALLQVYWLASLHIAGGLKLDDLWRFFSTQAESTYDSMIWKGGTNIA